MIFIDDREDPKIARIFKKLNVDFQIKRLDIGDIYCPEKNLFFERKTMVDFANSVKIGHLLQQLINMQDCQNSYLLISGNSKDLFFAGVNFSKVQFLGALASFSVKFQTKILRVETDNQLCELVLKIIEKTDNGKEIIIPILKEKSGDLRVDILCQIPGISRLKAQAIISKFLTIYSVCIASEEQLQQINGIGVKLARSIKTALNIS
mgnify:CR=1 FL=1